jgi:hypothetical protein
VYEETAIVGLRASVGYAPHEPEVSLETLIKRAEAAMRLAKMQGDHALKWSAAVASRPLSNQRKKCAACRATTTLLVLADSKREAALSSCSNCGEAYPAHATA